MNKGKALIPCQIKEILDQQENVEAYLSPLVQKCLKKHKQMEIISQPPYT